MKRLFQKSLMLLPVLLPLASCGIDMRNWPYVDLSFSAADVNCVYIDYQNNLDDSKSAKYYSEKNEAIEGFYDLLENTHANPKTTSSTKDLQNCDKKISIYFLLDNDIYDFKAYVQGLSTYLLYDDEIREFPADFESVFLLRIDDVSDYLVEVI